jgi:type VII secretion-associated protein (TIGR03931 family)
MPALFELPVASPVNPRRPGTAVYEVGPAVVRRLAPSGLAPLSPDPTADAALAAGDDELTLVDDCPVVTSELWSEVFAGELADVEVTSVLLIHPSWWPQGRIDAVADVARRVATPGTVVETCARMRIDSRAAVFVEVGSEHVAIGGDGRNFTLLARDEPLEQLVQRAVADVGDQCTAVSLDAPAGVTGARALAAALGTRLREAGSVVEEFDIRRAAVALLDDGAEAEPEVSGSGAPKCWRRPARTALAAASVIAAVAGAAVGLDALGVPGKRSQGSEIAKNDWRTTEVIEGVLAVEVPAGWSVRRITDGPGSARVQLNSSQDPQTAVHVTQARVPDGDLAATAATLLAAVSTQPPGVFVDFDPTSRRGDRPAVTYREVRAGHDIRWAVFVDGDLRIGVGCQRGPVDQTAADAACDRVVRGAHRIR